MRDVFKTKWFFIFLPTVVVVCVGLVFLMVSQDHSPPPPSDQVGDILKQVEVPLVQTEVGKTTKDEVESLDNLIESEESEGGTLYKLESGRPLQPHEVSVKNGVVVHETTVVSVRTTELFTYPRITDYLDVLGNPERVIEGSSRRGPFVETYLYPSRGLVIVGNPHTNEVLEFERFLPMSLEEYLDIYGSDITTLKEHLDNDSHEGL